MPTGRYRVHARVSGYVYRSTNNDACYASIGRYGPGGAPNPYVPRARILKAQVVLERSDILDSQQTPDPSAWVIVPMLPAAPDSSVYEGDLTVTVKEPYAVTFWRGSGVAEYAACGSHWSTDQTVTITVTPAPETNLQPALALACEDARGNGGVTRGDTLTCRINKVDPAAQGAITVSGWSFDAASRRDGDLLSLEWKGVMVKSGTVQVKARLGTKPEETLSATVVVVNRDWSGRTPRELVEIFDARDVSDSTLMLSRRIQWAHDLGQTGFRRSADASQRAPDPTAEVRGGPNHEMFLNRAGIAGGSNS